MGVGIDPPVAGIVVMAATGVTDAFVVGTAVGLIVGDGFEVGASVGVGMEVSSGTGVITAAGSTESHSCNALYAFSRGPIGRSVVNGSEPWTMQVFTCSGERPGFLARSSAATPETNGAAIDVPDINT